MAVPTDHREQIVDAALRLAAARHWEAVRLRDVAAATGLTLDGIRRHFREKEDLVDACFDRADRAMLAAAEADGFDTLTSRERLHRLIMAWLAALEPHHAVVRQMLVNRLEPGHLHVQVPALLRISRTVQWVREAAGRDATFVRRALEETALTGIYLTTFAYWLGAADGVDAARSPVSDTGASDAGAVTRAGRTARLLSQLLRQAGVFERILAAPSAMRRSARGAKRAPPVTPADAAAEQRASFGETPLDDGPANPRPDPGVAQD